MKRWIFAGLVASLGNARAEPVRPDTPSQRSYAGTAALIDVAVFSGSAVTTLAWPRSYPEGPVGGFNPGPVMMGLGLLGGGALTHTLYGNPVAAKSVMMRSTGLGAGAAIGLGSGVALGGATGLVCAAAGGGYCPLALVYGTVFGTVIGGAVGVGSAMIRDYRQLAQRPEEIKGAGRFVVRPTISVAASGSANLGLVGAF